MLTFQTAYIKSHVINIQEATGKSVKRIREFSAVVQEVNDLIASISTAIEEQSGMTQEIAANVSRTSEQLNRINAHTTRSATTSEAIVADMQGLNSEAVQTSKCGIEVDRKRSRTFTIVATAQDTGRSLCGFLTSG